MKCRICDRRGPFVNDFTDRGPICTSCAEFRELLADFLKETSLSAKQMLALHYEAIIQAGNDEMEPKHRLAVVSPRKDCL